MIVSPLADFLIRIKNASLAGRKEITSPASKFRLALCEVLKKAGFVGDYRVEGEVKKTIIITSPAVTFVNIFSKPSRRLYQKHSSLPWGKTRRSLILVSTSKGILSQKQAKSLKIGGELLAEIY